MKLYIAKPAAIFLLYLAAAVFSHAEMDQIKLGKTSPEDLEGEFEGKGYSMTSGDCENHQYIDKDYAISVQFDEEGVCGFQAFGNIKLSEIDKFVKNNRDLGYWDELSEERRLERRVLDAEGFESGKSYEEGRVEEVTVIRKTPNSGEMVLEYWQKSGSSKKACFVAVYSKDRKTNFGKIEGVTHHFLKVEGDALIENLHEQGTLFVKEGTLYGMRVSRRGETDVDEPEANGFKISTGGEPYSVKYVGYFDFRNDGLAVDHEVFLWDRNENLVFQQTIPAGDTGKLNGSFRWVELDQPWILEADSIYFLTASTHTQSGRYDNPASIQASVVTGSRKVQVSGDKTLWIQGKKLKDLKFPNQEGSQWLKLGPNIATELIFN